MATETVPANELRVIDLDCQDMAEEVETLCNAARALLAAAEGRRDVERLLAMISDRAFETMNRVNSTAGKYGCNYKEAIHG